MPVLNCKLSTNVNVLSLNFSANTTIRFCFNTIEPLGSILREGICFINLEVRGSYNSDVDTI